MTVMSKLEKLKKMEHAATSHITRLMASASSGELDKSEAQESVNLAAEIQVELLKVRLQIEELESKH